MDLILLRHGKAEDSHPDGDSARALEEKGRQQARRAAKVLLAADFLPEIVLTSPLVRARQTADEFSQASGVPGAVIQGWLGCGMHPETALQELTAFHDFQRVCIIGHEPDFSGLIEWVLESTGGGVDVKKASIACLQLNPPSRHGILRFLIPQRLARDLVHRSTS